MRNVWLDLEQDSHAVSAKDAKNCREVLVSSQGGMGRSILQD